MENLTDNDVRQPSVMTTAQFLDLIHGTNASIYFNVNGITWKNKPQPFSKAESKLQWLNDQGSDIYFIVNAGGSKVVDITKITSAFMDWDAGKDSNNKYFSEDIVQQKKQQCMSRICQFSLKPSFIVETRNGYQVYWLLSSCTKEEFSAIQCRLIAFFGSDNKVKNLNRVMRLPNFFWQKKKSGCKPFFVRIIEFNDLRYHAFDLLNALPVCFESEKSKKKVRISTPNNHQCINTVINYNKDTGIIGGTFSAFPNIHDVMDYLKRQDLSAYLHASGSEGINGIKINCPFHTDVTPSAGIYRNSTTDHWLLKCHSSQCDFDTGSIIDVVMKQRNIDMKAAVQHLMDYYQIRIDPEAWKKEQQRIYDNNIDVLNNIDNYKEQYPCLHKVIHRIQEDLVLMNTLAKECIDGQPISIQGQAAFFCSLRYFWQRKKNLQELPTSHNKLTLKIDRFCLLGLLIKLSDDAIPDVYLKNAKLHQNCQHGVNQKKISNRQHRVQFYVIPPYTSEIFNEAENVAKGLNKQKIRLKGISRKLILDVFGEQVANRVYPQCRDLPHATGEDIFTLQVLDAMFNGIKSKDYTTVKEIHDQLLQNYDWTQVTERRIYRILPGLLSVHGLKEVFANSELKAKYGIQSDGYPKIIIRTVENPTNTVVNPSGGRDNGRAA